MTKNKKKQEEVKGTHNTQGKTNTQDAVTNTKGTSKEPQVEPTKNQQGYMKHARKYAIALAVAFGIGGCVAGYALRDSQEPATLATTTYGSPITSDIYKTTVKDSTEAQSLLAQDIVNQVFAEKYASEVTDKDVDTEFASVKETYGDSFEEALTSSGFETEKDFKDYLRTQLITQAGLKANIKVTDEDLKEAWSTFVPVQELKVATFATKEEAEAYKKDPNNDKFKEYIKQVKAGTSDNQAELTQETLEAALKLKEGDTSKVLETKGVTKTQYYVITSIKHVDKGNDMKPFEKELDTVVKTNKLNDQQASKDILKKVLKDANLTFEDKDLEKMFNNALDLDAK